jgi:hypothetical protein
MHLLVEHGDILPQPVCQCHCGFCLCNLDAGQQDVLVAGLWEGWLMIPCCWYGVLTLHRPRLRG